nr:uncharacterized protein LOC129438507 isoform X3 [Misgurnus anguillicaudatus]
MRDIPQVDQCVKMKLLACQRMKPDISVSPGPSIISLQSDQSMERPIVSNDRIYKYMSQGMKPVISVSPGPSITSLRSDQSMERPIVFNDQINMYLSQRMKQNISVSPVPSIISLRSDQSMERPIVFNDQINMYLSQRMKQNISVSPVPSITSLRSDQSMERPIVFKDHTKYMSQGMKRNISVSPVPSITSLRSDQSIERQIVCKDRTKYISQGMKPDISVSPVPSITSLRSDQSMERPIVFNDKTQYISTLSATLLTEDHYRCSVCTEVFKNPVSIPCGHSYCKHCIEIYWSKPTQAECYACPQCRKRFRDRPVLNVNVALAKVIDELQQAGFSPALPDHCYAGPEDVSCDICTEMKLKAVKSCLTCCVSYCETHVRQHYTVPALQRHKLTEVCNIPESKICIDVALLKEENKKLRTRLFEVRMTSVKENECFYPGLEVHCKDLKGNVVEVPALGRPCALGTLYDCHSDSFKPDVYLWDGSTISNMRVSQSQLQTCFNILEEDSLQSRFRVFEMSPVLQAKALAGQIDLGGAAVFLNHPIQSEHQDRVTLHYKTTTRLDMISQTLLHEGVSPSVINTTTATHVIIAVSYGAQAFFVFDHWLKNSEKTAEMKDVIKKMSSSFCASHISSSLNDSEKAMSLLYNCSLYIDVGDWKSPVSFDEAVKIYVSLPELLGSKGEKAVPLKVWLYPLKKLERTSACAALSGVNESVKDEAEVILNHLRKQFKMCQDMMTACDNLCLPALTEKEKAFSKLLWEYQTEFQRQIAEIVASKNEQECFQELIKMHDRSPFSAKNIQQCLENMETKLAILNACRVAEISILTSEEQLQHLLNNPEVINMFCFTISSAQAEDSFLAASKQHIEAMRQSKSHNFKPKDMLRSTKPVFSNGKVLNDLKEFITATKVDDDVEQTKFVASFLPDVSFFGHSVCFYHSGKIVSRNVKLNLKPEPAVIANIKHTSVALNLNQAQNKSVERYIVEYRATDGTRIPEWKWKNIDPSTPEEPCVLSGLQPDTQYQLRFMVSDNGCLSNFSRITAFQTTYGASPGQPTITKLGRDALKITWLKAEADEDCPVLQYMVEYGEAGLEGWSSVLTQGPQCECTLTVPHSTCYRVRVSAVYGEQDLSKPSEETSVPVDVWTINLSEIKPSILLEVLKHQTEKKPVELIDWTDDESEVRGFIQCLPYISQLRFNSPQDVVQDWEKRKRLFILDACLQAALQNNIIEASVETLLSCVDYGKCDFLLDLYSHVKDYESKTGRSVLPALQSIYRSVPAVWYVNLSERKTSLLLNLLTYKQAKKQPVKLRRWSEDESEVREFLQCLPYISQLRFCGIALGEEKKAKSAAQFLVNLFVLASEAETDKIVNYIELLKSVCTYTSFPCDGNSEYYLSVQCQFLLDLYSHVKKYESQTGRSVLPALQSIYQSSPAVWIINLSEIKPSILLEVLKLQTEKKPVELIDWTDDESEVKGFIHCLPYISQLRFSRQQKQDRSSDGKKRKRLFMLNLFLQAALQSKEMVEATLGHHVFFSRYDKCDFLLDLCSHVKYYESQTGSSVLSALQSIYQSPAVWVINLSKRKTSILLEVLKLQTEKKPVELIDWTDDESEVRGFIQCLPYISQLR